MFTTGELVKGSYWPETVEIKKCDNLSGDYFIIETLGRRSSTYYQIILEKDELLNIERLSSALEDTSIINAEDLQHYLQYFTLKTDQKYSQARSMGGSNILPLPHQIDAVYRKMLQSPQIRYLLADDPGAGKTIMSGMLIKELKARKSAERVLILTPPLVLAQWQEELREKFHEDFTVINRSLKESLQGQNPFEFHDRCLVSMHWAARDDIKELILNAEFDLVIVDEAHKMAAYTHGKKQRSVHRTGLYRLGEALLNNTDHCLLLTATPHKGDMENYRHLLSLLDKDVFAHLHAEETLRNKSNPYVIRRLKENMVNFNNTPIFPKRTTVTVEFDLTHQELELYEAVTEYVQDHFNRASERGNNSTTFAMMVLQRRLSSSLEAVHLSLKRRKEKLLNRYHQTIVGEIQNGDQGSSDLFPEWEEMNAAEQSIMEEEIEGTSVSYNTDELRKELNELDNLIEVSTIVRQNEAERKFFELEETLFGENGLISRGEKVLIFTEFKDTLDHLYKSLLEHVPEIAVISGEYSVEKRRQQVELFRDKAQIMLATDAGGESINLQFCNQMINYDIPWNPNRLEQRMGRIHRIGQKNEVFVFNLVARNTREGDVLIHLLTKMDQMREDLGYEGVYDFIGEVLEDQGTDLATLMQQAVTSRQKIDSALKEVDTAITEEHKDLIRTMQEEKIAETEFDLTGLRKERNEVVLNSLPPSAYTNFLIKSLKEKNVPINKSSSRDLYRVDRLPKSVREFASRNKITVSKAQSSYRFTTDRKNNMEDVTLMNNDHPLFNIAMKLTENTVQSVAAGKYYIKFPVKEKLNVFIYELEIGDGNGTEHLHSVIYLAERENGELIQLDPYWLFSASFSGLSYKGKLEENEKFMSQLLQIADGELKNIRNKKEGSLIKKLQFLKKVFESQYENVSRRLSEYRDTNIDQRNTALINQMKSQLEEIQERREARLNEVMRERSIFIKSMKPVGQLETEPNGHGIREITNDWKEIIFTYERNAGRINVRKLKSYGLVDFYSEEFSGEPRYIILVEKDVKSFPEEYLKDLAGIANSVYIYILENAEVSEEVSLSAFN
jgi:superfamily II DNA or RNA helicase